MDEETKKLLTESLELAKENNNMLKSLTRAMQFSRIMTILYWVLIIGSAVGAFYFIQPVLDPLINAYGGCK